MRSSKEIFVNMETKQTFNKLKEDSMRNFLELDDFRSASTNIPKRKEFSLSSPSSFSSRLNFKKDLKTHFLTTVDDDGNTLWHAAAYHGDLELINKIFKAFESEKAELADLVKKKNNIGLDVMHFYILYTTSPALNSIDNNNRSDYKFSIFENLLEHVDLSAKIIFPSDLNTAQDGSVDIVLIKEKEIKTTKPDGSTESKLIEEKKITAVRGENYLQFALHQGAPQEVCGELLAATRPNYQIKGKKIKTNGAFLVDGSTHELASKLGYRDLFDKLPTQTASYAGAMGTLAKNNNLEPWALMAQYVRDLNDVKLNEYLKSVNDTTRDLVCHNEKSTGSTLLTILAKTEVINFTYKDGVPVAFKEIEWEVGKATKSAQTKVIAEILCEYSANVDDGAPLLTAVLYGNLELAKFLESKRASLKLPDADKNNIVHCAVLSGRLEMVEWVVVDLLGQLKYSEFRSYTKKLNADGKTPLRLSVEAGTYEISRMLLKECNDRKVSVDKVQIDAIDGLESAVLVPVFNLKDPLGRSYLSQSVVHEDLNEFLKILSVPRDKINFASTDLSKQTFLHILCAKNLSNFLYRENTNLISAITYKSEKILKTFSDEEVVKYLVPLLTEQDKDGNTPFHLVLNHSAKDHSEDDLFRYLWDIFANHTPDNRILHIVNKNGQNILHLICAANKVDLFARLCAPKWNVEELAGVTDVDGNTVWHLAVINSHVEIIEKLIGHGRLTSNVMNMAGNSFLHEIILRGDLKLWNLLLDKMHPAVFDQLMWRENNSGQNALHLIMANNSLTDNGEKVGEKFFHALVQKRADAYVFNTPAAKKPDGNDMQQIHFAICGGLLGIVRHYFDKGQQALVFSTQRELHYPAMVGNKAMFDLLMEKLPEVEAPTVLNFNFKEATPIMAALKSGHRSIFLDLQKNTCVKVFSPYDFITPNSNAQSFDTILHLAVENSTDSNMAEEETYLSKVLIKVKGIVNAAIKSNNIQEIFGCIMFLLWPNLKGQTAFLLAVKRGDQQILNKLFAELLPLVSKWLAMQVSQSFPEGIGNDDIRKVLKKCRDEYSINNANQQLEDILYSFIFLQAEVEQGNTCVHEVVFNQNKVLFEHIFILLFKDKEIKDLGRFKEVLKIKNKAQQTVVHAAAMVFSNSPEYFHSLTDELRVKDKAFFKEVMLMSDGANNSPVEYMAKMYFELETKKAQNPESKKVQDDLVLFVSDMLPLFGFSIEAAIEWALNNKQNELLLMLLKTCDEELFVAGFARLVNGMVASANTDGLERLIQMLEEKEELRDKIKQSDEIMSSIKPILFDMFISINKALETCSEKLIKVICDQEMTFPFYAAAYDVDLLSKYFEFIGKNPKIVSYALNKNNQTLMHVAIQYGNERAVKLMFSLFAKDENAKEFANWILKADGFAKPTMAYAIKTGMMFVLMQVRSLGIPYSVEANTQYKRTLIDEWAELNEQKLSGRYDQSAATAVIKDLGKVLIEEFKSYIGKKNAYGKAPVHVAAENSNHTVLQVLAENKAKFLQLTKGGNLALHFALRNNDAKSIEIITKAMITSVPEERLVECGTPDKFLDVVKSIVPNLETFSELNAETFAAITQALPQVQVQPLEEANPPVQQPSVI